MNHLKIRTAIAFGIFFLLVVSQINPVFAIISAIIVSSIPFFLDPLFEFIDEKTKRKSKEENRGLIKTLYCKKVRCFGYET